MTYDWLLLGIYAVLSIVVLFTIGYFTFYMVPQQEVAIIERFGRYVRTAPPGLRMKIPFVDYVAHRQSLRVHQLDVAVQTKTRDNVFVDTNIAVQYFVPSQESAFNAYYELNDPEEQIRSYVYDVVRAELPKLNLDDVFDRKDEISNKVQDALQDVMQQYGFEIRNALMTDIDPDADVKRSMNSINAAKREKSAAEHLAEAERIIKVKNAEADKQAKILQGEGIAGQRQAIAAGLRDAIESVVDKEKGISAQDVINLINFTNYTDMLKDVGSASNTIMIPHVTGAVDSLEGSFRNAMIAVRSTNLVDAPVATAELNQGVVSSKGNTLS